MRIQKLHLFTFSVRPLASGAGCLICTALVRKVVVILAALVMATCAIKWPSYASLGLLEVAVNGYVDVHGVVEDGGFIFG